MVGAGISATRAPHLPQKANPSGFVKPQEGHRDASLVPQRPQNVIAGGFSKAHRGQVTPRAPSIPWEKDQLSTAC
jgi:hypothetical protein